MNVIVPNSIGKINSGKFEKLCFKVKKYNFVFL